MNTIPKFFKNSHKTHKLELLEESANEMQQDERQKADGQANSQNKENLGNTEVKPQIDSLCNLIETEEEGVKQDVCHNFISS